MKKSLLLLLVAMSISLSGFAQKGMQAVGAAISPVYHFKSKGLGFGVEVHYSSNLTDYIRLVPNIKYSSVEQDTDWWSDGRSKLKELQIGADLDVFLTPNQRIRPYLTAGIYCSRLEEETDSFQVYKGSAIQPSTNIGIGLEYRITHKASLQTEFTYNLPVCNQRRWLNEVRVEEFQSLKLGVGITYYL